MDEIHVHNQLIINNKIANKLIYLQYRNNFEHHTIKDVKVIFNYEIENKICIYESHSNILLINNTDKDIIICDYFNKDNYIKIKPHDKLYFNYEWFFN